MTAPLFRLRAAAAAARAAYAAAGGATVPARKRLFVRLVAAETEYFKAAASRADRLSDTRADRESDKARLVLPPVGADRDDNR